MDPLEGERSGSLPNENGAATTESHNRGKIMKENEKSKSEANASSEASTNPDNNNVAAQANPANPNKAITLVALTPDGGTASLATVLFPEDSSSTPKKSKLSTEEESSLERLEQVIERGIATFVEVGAALHQIQSQRLYRQKHDSFEAYLASRWNFKRAHAYRLINAYRVLETIQDEDGKVLSESHTRQLARLPEDQRAEALLRAKELAGKKTRTAKHIQQAVDDLLGKSKKKSPSKSTDDEEDDNNGGVSADKPTPPPTPTGGAAAPRETPGTPMPPDTELVNELLALARGTRDLLTTKKDVNAAIEQLFRIEQVLTKAVAKVNYSGVEILEDETEEASNCTVGTFTRTRQLQAA